MTDKEKCNQLKAIRKDIADKLGIDLNQQNCEYDGDCDATCPKCEQEEMMLNEALSGGKRVVLHDLPDAERLMGSLKAPEDFDRESVREVRMGKLVPNYDDE